MKKYYRYVECMYGEELWYVVGYGNKYLDPDYYKDFSEFECEEVPTESLFYKLQVEEPVGSIASEIDEWE